MNTSCYEIEEGKVRELPSCDFERNKANGVTHLYDIAVDKREEAVEVLQSMMLDGVILKSLLSPSEHILFEFFGDCAYGELAYFSADSSDPVKYLAVIQYAKSIFFIHDGGEAVFKEFFKSLSRLMEYPVDQLGPPFLFFVLVRNILSANGKLILSYREEIEDIDKDFDHKYVAIDPAEFKKFKTHLSDFNRTIEKQYYALSFPPTKSMINHESAYALYFKELIRTLDVLKSSLDQTEKRLNSLHNHYNLIIQSKSNKRLNFLTIIQAIFVPLTLLAGIYGMNFAFIPALNLRYGYFFFLGVMVVVASIFLRYFYKHGWFD